jgi:uncharacterized protein (DUF1501 family)
VKERCDCDRRSFLKGSGLTLAGFSLMSLMPGPLLRHAMAAPAAGNGKRMLFIFLRGGNDGLNAVIPHGDPDYNAINRPTLYIPPAEAVNLNGFVSLHPALGPLKPIYDANELAVIHRVGYANSSHSHFDGQRIWENGDPTRPKMFEGWLHRFVQQNSVAAGASLPVITAQPTSPLLLRGDQSYVNIANPDEFDFLHLPPKRDKYSMGWRERYTDLSGLQPYRPQLADAGLKLIDTLDLYRGWDQANWNPLDPVSGDSLFPVDALTNPDDPDGPGGKKFSADSYDFFKSLKVCALSLLENADTRIAGTELGGWDLHDGQGGANGDHAELLSWLAYGISSLQIALSGAANDDRGYASIWQDTVVTTMSEFGRTTSENGSFGTDHANASCMFAAGGAIQGGAYNADAAAWPAGVMFGINGRYLLQQTDYRAIFWEILRDHMGAATTGADGIFPGYTSSGLSSQELGLIGA